MLPLQFCGQLPRFTQIRRVCEKIGRENEIGRAQKRYEKYEQYSRTKLENHLFAFELARRLAETGVAVNVLEPGVIQTKLLAAGGFSGAPVAKGAVAPVFLAGSDKVEGVSGKYFDNSGREIRACDESLDVNDQKKLWDVTEKLLSKFL